MTAPTVADAGEATTIVWIDAREAIIARWQHGEASVEHLASEVPAHHRATGQVRHAHDTRPGGGPPRSAGESHRLEHLRRFVEAVAGRVADDPLLILGPGAVPGRLATLIGDDDRRRLLERSIVCRRSAPMTEPQLLAELRTLAGIPRTRRPFGTYRWSGVHDLNRRGEPLPPRRPRKPASIRSGETEVNE